MLSASVSFSTFSDELVKLAKGKVPYSKADALVYKALVKGSAVKIKITDEAHEYGGGYFDQSTKEIGLAKKDFKTLAHELGHAELDQHLLGRMIQSRTARLAYMASPLFSAGAGILMAKGKAWGLVLPVAAVAPTLVSEALATHEGGKILDELHIVKKHQRKAYEELTSKGLASYTAHATLGAVHGALAYALTASG